MIATEFRGLFASMKAHVDCDQMSPTFFAVFFERAKELTERVEKLETEIVPVHLRRTSPKLHPSQLELIQGGRP